MGEQKQPVIECIVHEWKPFIDAVKHQTGNVCLNCGARVVDGKQPQEGKPLTAEELLKIIIDDFYKDVPKGMRTDFQMLPDDPKRIIAAEAMRKYAAQETAALREELQGERVLAGVLNNATKDLEKELEAVKKERDGSVEIRDNSLGYLKICQEELIKVTRQRDELKKLCWTLGQLSELNGEVVDGYRTREVVIEMRRLSSGETKPVCPWISVDERLPEQGQTVAFVVDLPGQYRHGQVYGGKFTGSDFATPGCGQPASHWMPLPAPPESLIDKK